MDDIGRSTLSTSLRSRHAYTLVRRFIKTGIGFLAAGLLVGLYMLTQRELFGVWPHPYLRSAHMHAVFLGFVMFLILGVALWLFPRAETGDTRYRPERVEAAYWILTLSTSARFLGEVARAWSDADGLRWLVLLAGVGQVGGFAIYFFTMWTRIRPVGSHLREAKGERF
ncbi:MAG: cbb3-type cytochrome c oxidase subunit I [Gemmatimonadetes bacterium]|nr:cbb3-type cytochrome c oxidase subunit I [Gemmatimonadota bacterium]